MLSIMADTFMIAARTEHWARRDEAQPAPDFDPRPERSAARHRRWDELPQPVAGLEH